MSNNQHTYELFNGLVLRAPLFSIQFYLDLIDKEVIQDKELFAIISNPVVCEALQLASPELYTQVSLWMEGSISDKKKNERIKRTIIKYLIRMSTRCTPFGLFAGCTSGYFSKSTSIILDPVHKHKRSTRFDMHFLISLTKELAKDPQVQDHLQWFSNNSLYKTAGQWRYIEYTYSEGTRIHSLEAVNSFALLDQIIEECKTGKSLKQLNDILLNENIEDQEAKVFIDQLIQNQILSSNLEPSITGEDFLNQIIAVIQNIDGFGNQTNLLRQLKKDLKTMDEGIVNNEMNLEKIVNSLDNFNVHLNKKRLLQTDLFLSSPHCHLDVKWIYKLNKIFHVLNKITSVESDTEIDLFKKEFESRYERQEMPLSEVLDSDIGIGFPVDFKGNVHTPFLEDLPFPVVKKSDVKFSWDHFTNLLNEKIKKAISDNEHVIFLYDSDLKGFEDVIGDLPDTMFAKAQLATINGEDRLVLGAINGRSASTILTRFCYGDKGIHELVSKISNKEEELQKNKIVAEIVHVSSDHIGNVIQRPLLREFEIPYLAKSGVSLESQILVSDITISIEKNRIKLKSKKMKKEIIPYLSTAHNFNNSPLPIYRFLSFLGNSSTRDRISFDWGNLSSIYHFLPRVEYNKIILSKAKWIVQKSEIQIWYEILENKNKLFHEVGVFREKRNIPQFVCIGESDNIMPINLENFDSLEIFLSAVRANKWFVLEEFIFADGNSPVQSSNKESFANEFIFCFYNSKVG